MNEYAELLYVHPNYLNDVVKEITGFPGKSLFIQKQLIQEAKSRLVKTSDTVSMIAMELQFMDDSYFKDFLRNKQDLLHYSTGKDINTKY